LTDALYAAVLFQRRLGRDQPAQQTKTVEVPKARVTTDVEHKAPQPERDVTLLFVWKRRQFRQAIETSHDARLLRLGGGIS